MATRSVFVVHEHHASRLHYDFRLEIGGVLVSWAVPKGPSMNPADKRLAVRVDDHPLAYGAFEGVIPAGRYGAGPVVIWDHGAILPTEGELAVGLKAGALKFALKGKRLSGAFALVRMQGPRMTGKEWLLMKKADEHADARFRLVLALTPAARSRLKALSPPCETT
ncbi:MAG: 3'-phosphoesterase [Candidatus Omnitrophica bacterium]|nr:3'-phosphoesterase [Candidatus Omnitrophota bacterium]